MPAPFVDYMDEYLKFAVDNGMIDLSYVQKQMEMKKRKEILEKHKYEIWLGNDGFWRTYLPDENKRNGRRLIKRKERKDLDDVVIEYILEHEKKEENDKKKNISLVEIFPEWIEYKSKHTNSSSYIKRITSDWKKYYSRNVDLINKPLKDFTKIELDNWAHEMIKENNMSKKQYYNMSIILRGCMDHAVECGYIKENVFSSIKIRTKMFRKVKKKPSETQVYLTDEIPKIIYDMIQRFQSNPKDTSPLAVLLDFEIGVRIGELAVLRKSDISLNGKYIYIQRQLVREYEKIDEAGFTMRSVGYRVAEYTKSDDGFREVYLTDFARNILKIVFEANEKYGNKYEDYIFVKGNSLIGISGIDSHIRKGCKSIGIITKTMHKVRKTYISSLIDSGLNIDEVRRQAGHSDERTTYGNYCYNRMTSSETENKMEDALNFNLCDCLTIIE